MARPFEFYRWACAIAAVLLGSGVFGLSQARARPLCTGVLPAMTGRPALRRLTPPALVYDNRSLADVALDLTHLGPRAVRVDSSSQEIRFSGVLVVGDQESMVARLSRLLFLRASCEGGVLVLHRRPSSGG